MSERMQVYWCETCGAIVEVIRGGTGRLVCCAKPMKLLKENTVDAALEKHVPVIERADGGYRVTVGSTLHPMLEEHYIEWIELVAGNDILRTYLKPGDKPQVFFRTDAASVFAREHCNLHGHWRKDFEG